MPPCHPPPHPSCPIWFHSILSCTTFPPAQSPAASAELQEKQSPGQVVSPHPVPKAQLQGALPPLKTRKGLGCPEPLLRWLQTFQRFPHSLHSTNVVMGSSALRVCTWGGAALGQRRPFWCAPNQGPLGTRPDLVVRAVLLLALATLEEVGDGAACLGHLVLPDGLLGHGIPQLLQLITGHLLPPALAQTGQCGHGSAHSQVPQSNTFPILSQTRINPVLCLLEGSDPPR